MDVNYLYSPRVSNMSEVSHYKIFAPGSIVFSAGKFECNCGHPCDHIRTFNNRLVYKMIENLVSSGLDVSIVNPKTLVIQLQATAIQLYASLYRNYVPIELIKIVDTYYGSQGPSEGIIYPFIAKMIGSLLSNYSKPYTNGAFWNLPYRNTAPSDFTSTLYWNFGFGVGYRQSPFDEENAAEILNDYTKYTIHPELFYTIYKSVNHLDDFVPPERTDAMPPSLIPPNMYHFN